MRAKYYLLISHS